MQRIGNRQLPIANCEIVLTCLLLAGMMATAAAQLAYVESSNGLIPPTMEAGKTELEFADIDDDGNLDILSIGDHGNPYVNTDQHGIMIWFGDGQGNWNVFQFGDGFGYGGIAVGDVNNDGKWDIGCGMHHNYARPGQQGYPLGTKLEEVALGDGTGRNWVAWDSGLATNGETWGMFGTDFADFNNDGWLDAVWNSFGGSAGVHAYLNCHTGHWVQSFGFVGGMSKSEVTTGDINNDGAVDFVVGQQYGSVYFGDGTGNFTLKDCNLPLPSGSQGRPGVALGDIDNDGAREFSFVDAAGGIDVWRWNQTGDSWVNMGGNLPGSGYEGTQLCDMNCDGYVDVLGFGNGTGTVWLGDGQGNWTQTAIFSTPSPGTYRTLRAGGDIDHNGFPDIALVAVAGSRNYVRCFKEASVPAALRITPKFPQGGENFCRGSVQFIDWVCAVPAADTARVRLEFSSTGPGGPWTLVADRLRNSGRYQWTVSDVPSSNCYVRYIATTRTDTDTVLTSRPFTILPFTGIGTLPRTGYRRGLGVTVFPSPACGRAVVGYELPVPGPVRVTLLDVAGRAVLRQSATGNLESAMTLNLRAVPAGVYLVRLDADGCTATQKLVVQRDDGRN